VSDVIVQLIEDDVAHPANIVNRLIIDVTKPAIDPRTGRPPVRWPVHTRVYFPVVGAEFTCESTVWGLHSGMRISESALPCDVRLRFKVPWTEQEKWAALSKAIDMENSRAWYNFALTFCDIILYPTRGWWARRYQRTGKAPFVSARTNCSECVDILAKVHVDLWPGMPASLTVPGDYLSCPALEIVT
jgi:hypothetical protein